MAGGVQRKGGKKNRKWGRNVTKCARYKANDTLRKRKVKNIVRVNKLHPVLARECWTEGREFPKAEQQ